MEKWIEQESRRESEGTREKLRSHRESEEMPEVTEK